MMFVIFAVLTVFSYPGLEALFAEQAGLIVGFLLAAAIAALVGNRLGWAGFLLALATIKPQMCALLILYLLLWAMAEWRERWKLAISFFATLAALILSAMLVWPRWIAEWLDVLLHYRDYSNPPLLASLFGPHLGMVLIVLTLIAAVGFAWHKRSEPPASGEFGLVVSMLLAITTVTLLPEHAVYDHVILLPAIMVVARSWRGAWARNRIVRLVLALAAATVFWPWFAALAVEIIEAVSPRAAAALVFLPLRTAAALPFVVLGVLWMLRRDEGPTALDAA